jgi:para-aminobenzoate synthetase component I
MISRMNYYGKNHVPFLFIIDFDIQHPVLIPLADLDGEAILFSINGFANHNDHVYGKTNRAVIQNKYPISYTEYRNKFDFIIRHQMSGNSYLLNLTCPTKIQTDLSFTEIYHRCRAKYRLLYKDTFLVFSPETFITIHDGTISSHPMKGTIDAALPDAEKRILNDEKEFSEHLTIVDLIRNDMNRVATKVTVERFRYVEKVVSSEKTLLQTSSMITGQLGRDYHERIGSIIASLLPAGSVSGAPKKKTVEIIHEAEQYERGYYTGIFGYFDGTKLDSGVMIRYMEKIDDDIYYKSGGGITVYSDPEMEYQELIDKIYVPIN